MQFCLKNILISLTQNMCTAENKPYKQNMKQMLPCCWCTGYIWEYAWWIPFRWILQKFHFSNKPILWLRSIDCVDYISDVSLLSSSPVYFCGSLPPSFSMWLLHWIHYDPLYIKHETLQGWQYYWAFITVWFWMILVLWQTDDTHNTRLLLINTWQPKVAGIKELCHHNDIERYWIA